jgi:hypothetical protein
MDKDSDFEKELEMPVVNEEADPVDEFIATLFQDKHTPSRVNDVVKKRETKTAEFGDGSIPGKVDTLRTDETCPFGMGSNDCGLRDGTCDVCEYQTPVEGLDDPDTSKARQIDRAQELEKKEPVISPNRDKESPTRMNRPGRPSFARSASVQQVHFLYELIGNGFDDHAEKYIQDEIDAGRADADLMQAYGVLQMQGPDAFRDYVFKSDPQGVDMVEQLYGDDSPEDNPDPMEIVKRKNDYERNLKDWDPELSKGLPKAGPASRGNWNYLTGR